MRKTLNAKIGMRDEKRQQKYWKESGSNISPQVFNLPQLILDNFLDTFIEHGYHVGSSADLEEMER
jgi:glutaredoxin